MKTTPNKILHGKMINDLFSNISVYFNFVFITQIAIFSENSSKQNLWKAKKESLIQPYFFLNLSFFLNQKIIFFNQKNEFTIIFYVKLNLRSKRTLEIQQIVLKITMKKNKSSLVITENFSCFLTFQKSQLIKKY